MERLFLSLMRLARFILILGLPGMVTTNIFGMDNNQADDAPESINTTILQGLNFCPVLLNQRSTSYDLDIACAPGPLTNQGDLDSDDNRPQFSTYPNVDGSSSSAPLICLDTPPATPMNTNNNNNYYHQPTSSPTSGVQEQFHGDADVLSSFSSLPNADGSSSAPLPLPPLSGVELLSSPPVTPMATINNNNNNNYQTPSSSSMSGSSISSTSVVQELYPGGAQVGNETKKGNDRSRGKRFYHARPVVDGADDDMVINSHGSSSSSSSSAPKDDSDDGDNDDAGEDYDDADEDYIESNDDDSEDDEDFEDDDPEEDDSDDDYETSKRSKKDTKTSKKAPKKVAKQTNNNSSISGLGFTRPSKAPQGSQELDEQLKEAITTAITNPPDKMRRYQPVERLVLQGANPDWGFINRLNRKDKHSTAVMHQALSYAINASLSKSRPYPFGECENKNCLLVEHALILMAQGNNKTGMNKLDACRKITALIQDGGSDSNGCRNIYKHTMNGKLFIGVLDDRCGKIIRESARSRGNPQMLEAAKLLKRALDGISQKKTGTSITIRSSQEQQDDDDEDGDEEETSIIPTHGKHSQQPPSAAHNPGRPRIDDGGDLVINSHSSRSDASVSILSAPLSASSKDVKQQQSVVQRNVPLYKQFGLYDRSVLDKDLLLLKDKDQVGTHGKIIAQAVKRKLKDLGQSVGDLNIVDNYSKDVLLWVMHQCSILPTPRVEHQSLYLRTLVYLLNDKVVVEGHKLAYKKLEQIKNHEGQSVIQCLQALAQNDQNALARAAKILINDILKSFFAFLFGQHHVWCAHTLQVDQWIQALIANVFFSGNPQDSKTMIDGLAEIYADSSNEIDEKLRPLLIEFFNDHGVFFNDHSVNLSQKEDSGDGDHDEEQELEPVEEQKPDRSLGKGKSADKTVPHGCWSSKVSSSKQSNEDEQNQDEDEQEDEDEDAESDDEAEEKETKMVPSHGKSPYGKSPKSHYVTTTSISNSTIAASHDGADKPTLTHPTSSLTASATSSSSTSSTVNLPKQPVIQPKPTSQASKENAGQPAEHKHTNNKLDKKYTKNSRRSVSALNEELTEQLRIALTELNSVAVRDAKDEVVRLIKKGADPAELYEFMDLASQVRLGTRSDQVLSGVHYMINTALLELGRQVFGDCGNMQCELPKLVNTILAPGLTVKQPAKIDALRRIVELVTNDKKDTNPCRNIKNHTLNNKSLLTQLVTYCNDIKNNKNKQDLYAILKPLEGKLEGFSAAPVSSVSAPSVETEVANSNHSKDKQDEKKLEVTVAPATIPAAPAPAVEISSMSSSSIVPPRVVTTTLVESTATVPSSVLVVAPESVDKGLHVPHANANVEMSDSVALVQPKVVEPTSAAVVAPEAKESKGSESDSEAQLRKAITGLMGRVSDQEIKSLLDAMHNTFKERLDTFLVQPAITAEKAFGVPLPAPATASTIGSMSSSSIATPAKSTEHKTDVNTGPEEEKTENNNNTHDAAFLGALPVEEELGFVTPPSSPDIGADVKDEIGNVQENTSVIPTLSLASLSSINNDVIVPATPSSPSSPKSVEQKHDNQEQKEVTVHDANEAECDGNQSENGSERVACDSDDSEKTHQSNGGQGKKHKRVESEVTEENMGATESPLKKRKNDSQITITESELLSSMPTTDMPVVAKPVVIIDAKETKAENGQGHKRKRDDSPVTVENSNTPELPSKKQKLDGKEQSTTAVVGTTAMSLLAGPSAALSTQATQSVAKQDETSSRSSSSLQKDHKKVKDDDGDDFGDEEDELDKKESKSSEESKKNVAKKATDSNVSSVKKVGKRLQKKSQEVQAAMLRDQIVLAINDPSDNIRKRAKEKVTLLVSLGVMSRNEIYDFYNQKAAASKATSKKETIGHQIQAVDRAIKKGLTVLDMASSSDCGNEECQLVEVMTGTLVARIPKSDQARKLAELINSDNKGAHVCPDFTKHTIYGGMTLTDAFRPYWEKIDKHRLHKPYQEAFAILKPVAEILMSNCSKSISKLDQEELDQQLKELVKNVLSDSKFTTSRKCDIRQCVAGGANPSDDLYRLIFQEVTKRIVKRENRDKVLASIYYQINQGLMLSGRMSYFGSCNNDKCQLMASMIKIFAPQQIATIEVVKEVANLINPKTQDIYACKNYALHRMNGENCRNLLGKYWNKVSTKGRPNDRLTKIYEALLPVAEVIKLSQAELEALESKSSSSKKSAPTSSSSSSSSSSSTSSSSNRGKRPRSASCRIDGGDDEIEINSHVSMNANVHAVPVASVPNSMSEGSTSISTPTLSTANSSVNTSSTISLSSSLQTSCTNGSTSTLTQPVVQHMTEKKKAEKDAAPSWLELVIQERQKLLQQNMPAVIKFTPADLIISNDEEVILRDLNTSPEHKKSVFQIVTRKLLIIHELSLLARDQKNECAPDAKIALHIALKNIFMVLLSLNASTGKSEKAIDELANQYVEQNEKMDGSIRPVLIQLFIECGVDSKMFGAGTDIVSLLKNK